MKKLPSLLNKVDRSAKAKSALNFRSKCVQSAVKPSQTQIANEERTPATTSRALSKRIYERYKCIPIRGLWDKGVILSSFFITKCSSTISISRPSIMQAWYLRSHLRILCLSLSSCTVRLLFYVEAFLFRDFHVTFYTMEGRSHACAVCHKILSSILGRPTNLQGKALLFW